MGFCLSTFSSPKKKIQQRILMFYSAWHSNARERQTCIVKGFFLLVLGILKILLPNGRWTVLFTLSILLPSKIFVIKSEVELVSVECLCLCMWHRSSLSKKSCYINIVFAYELLLSALNDVFMHNFSVRGASVAVAIN